MTLFLVIGGTSRSETVVDLDHSPSPSILADGIGGVCRRGWQYYVIDAPDRRAALAATTPDGPIQQLIR